MPVLFADQRLRALGASVLDHMLVTSAGERTPALGDPGVRLSAYRDTQSQHRSIIAATKYGPLQSLSDRELNHREQPVTIYLQPKRVRAWVRFGAEAVRVDAKLMRSTPLAAGIEIRAEEQTFRCWVWGNAVAIDSA